MNGYRWAPSDLGPVLTRETPVQVVMARSPHRCPLSYGGSSADVIQLPDMAEWRFSRYNQAVIIGSGVIVPRTISLQQRQDGRFLTLFVRFQTPASSSERNAITV